MFWQLGSSDSSDSSDIFDRLHNNSQTCRLGLLIIPGICTIPHTPSKLKPISIGALQHLHDKLPHSFDPRLTFRSQRSWHLALRPSDLFPTSYNQIRLTYCLPLSMWVYDQFSRFVFRRRPWKPLLAG